VVADVQKCGNTIVSMAASMKNYWTRFTVTGTGLQTVLQTGE
jgi:hypothetical protein